ncbi:MAG: 23S rRNA (guanosine(2251)-2'-O)-methyltransferase RlmB [Pseudanabaenaceae cyanobacterium]
MDQPKLKPARRVTKVPLGNQDHDLIYGRHAVAAVLQSDRSVHKLWVIPRLRYAPDFFPLIDLAKEKGAVIEEVPAERLSQLTNGARHQGIALQVAAHQYLDLEDLVQQAQTASPEPVLLVADGITDPHNLGAIARSAEAMGAQGLIIPQRRAVGITSTVSKVAAGALAYLPVARVVNLNRALEYLKAQGFWVYGTTVGSGVPIYKMAFKGAIALVVGAEDTGISLLVQKNCDHLISIPLGGKTESLNASVAVGMVLYEIFRQRWVNQLTLPSQS